VDSFSVLVVDDEQDFLQALVARLSLRKLNALGVDNGPAALQHLEKSPVDVVVLDLKMPGMDGLQVLDEIKRRHPKVEVVILTGHGSVESGMEGVSRGAFAYLIKPVKIEELLEKIIKAYEWKQTNQKLPSE
jgi:two-component system OmpR family response regulator